jgi:hypothetical protein
MRAGCPSMRTALRRHPWRRRLKINKVHLYWFCLFAFSARTAEKRRSHGWMLYAYSSLAEGTREPVLLQLNPSPKSMQQIHIRHVRLFNPLQRQNFRLRHPVQIQIQIVGVTAADFKTGFILFQNMAGAF